MVTVMFPKGYISAEYNPFDRLFTTRELSPEIIEDTSIVNVINGSSTMILYDMTLHIISQGEKQTVFTFDPKPTEMEKEFKQLQSDVTYLSMMTDVEL